MSVFICIPIFVPFWSLVVRRCLRTMCTINIIDMRKHPVIHHTDLEKKLHVKNILDTLRFRRLQWAGHVLRMAEARLPRRLITSWVPRARPVGRPYFTYGHSLTQDLTEAKVDVKGWGKLTSDRAGWRALIRS